MHTISGVTKYKTFQVSPLCVQPLHQFEGINRVAQEAFRVLSGCRCQGIQLVSPPVTKTIRFTALVILKNVIIEKNSFPC